MGIDILSCVKIINVHNILDFFNVKGFWLRFKLGTNFQLSRFFFLMHGDKVLVVICHKEIPSNWIIKYDKNNSMVFWSMRYVKNLNANNLFAFHTHCEPWITI